MPVRVTLKPELDRRGMTSKELAQAIGISETQLSHFRSGKVRGLRFTTLSKICFVLQCAPGDLLDYDPDPADLEDLD